MHYICDAMLVSICGSLVTGSNKSKSIYKWSLFGTRSGQDSDKLKQVQIEEIEIELYAMQWSLFKFPPVVVWARVQMKVKV